MKNSIKILIVLIFSILVCSCNLFDYCRDPDKVNLIVIGTECGFSNVWDILEISRDDYLYSESKDHGNTFTDYTQAITENEWEELLYLLDVNKFVAISINTYTIPYDGCDTWIRIVGSEVDHQIRFDSYAREEIQSIRPFIDKLIEIRETFRD